MASLGGLSFLAHGSLGEGFSLLTWWFRAPRARISIVSMEATVFTDMGSYLPYTMSEEFTDLLHLEEDTETSPQVKELWPCFKTPQFLCSIAGTHPSMEG